MKRCHSRSSYQAYKTSAILVLGTIVGLTGCSPNAVVSGPEAPSIEPSPATAGLIIRQSKPAQASSLTEAPHAVSQPSMTSDGPSTHFIVLDDSVSMQEVRDGQPVFQSALTAVERLLNELRDSPDEAVVQVVRLVDGVPLLPEGKRLSELNVNAVMRELSTTGVSFSEPFSQGNQTAIQKLPSRDFVLYLFSDFRESDWIHGELPTMLRQLQDRAVATRLIDCGTGTVLPNVSLRSRGQLEPDRQGGFTLACDIRNDSATTVDVTVVARFGSEVFNQVSIGNLAGGETRTHTVTVPRSVTDKGVAEWSFNGLPVIEVSITEHDSWLLDNQIFAIVPRPTRVLVVSDDDATTNPVTSALQAAGQQSFQLTMRLPQGSSLSPHANPLFRDFRDTEEDDLNATISERDLADCDVLCMPDLLTLTATDERRLDAFLKRGGGVILFAGGESPDAAMRHINSEKVAAWLPITASAPSDVTNAEAGVSLDLRYFADAEFLQTMCEKVRVDRMVAGQLKDNVSILARYARERPLIVSQPWGKGRVVMGLFDLRDTNWWRSSSWPMMVAELHKNASLADSGRYSYPASASDEPTAVVGRLLPSPAIPTESSYVIVSEITRDQRGNEQFELPTNRVPGIYATLTESHRRLSVFVVQPFNVELHRLDREVLDQLAHECDAKVLDLSAPSLAYFQTNPVELRAIATFGVVEQFNAGAKALEITQLVSPTIATWQFGGDGYASIHIATRRTSLPVDDCLVVFVDDTGTPVREERVVELPAS